MIFLNRVSEIERNSKEVYYEIGQEEYIKEWLVIGPFRQEMDTDFFQAQAGEANIHPYEEMMVTAPDGETYTWKRYQSESDFIDLQDAMKQLLFSIEPRFQSELDDANEYPSFETLTTKDGLAYNNIEAIYEDGDGLLWIAMQGYGIYTYNHGSSCR